MDWEVFLSTVFAEHLQGIVYRAASDLSAPDWVIQTLRNAYYHEVAANTVRIRAIESLEAALTGSDIAVMLIKGAALIDSVYSDPGLRPMEDIDLLIRSSDRKSFETLLAKCGYHRDPVFDHLFSKDGITLDLHGHPLNIDRVSGRHHLFPIGARELWAGSVPWRPGFRNIRRPDDVDHMLILTHHMIKHSISKMIWLVDIDRLLKDRNLLFFCELNRKISAYRQERPIAFLLYLLEAVMGAKPARIRIGRDPKRMISWLERAMLDIRIQGGSIGDLGNFLWWRCLPGHHSAFRFGLETLFPPKEVLMCEQSQLPASSAGSPYLYRCGEIFLRLWVNLILLAGGTRKGRVFSQKH